MVSSPRAARRAATAAALWLAAACSPGPKLEELPPPAVTITDPSIVVESAAVVGGRVVATFTVKNAGAPVDLATAKALSPSWTLAYLGVEAVSGLPAWESLVQTGSQTVASLPPAGPGTPAGAVRTAVKQPGAESTTSTPAGTLAEVGSGDGRFTYTYGTPISSATDKTVRVGVYLRGATTGTARTRSTFDFVPDGVTPLATRALVDDAKCNGCHGELKMHGGRISGVKLCVTCHSWLLADPDTTDPAALSDLKTSYPNPLELARMVHRIHRGKKLPTLYLAASGDTWPAVPFTQAPPLPYPAAQAAMTAAKLPSLAPDGTKYAVVGNRSTEFVFGRVAVRVDNFQPAKSVAEGVGYPQDLRNCEACHLDTARALIGTAAPANPASVSISRRTCSGCHPDAFYGDGLFPGRLAPTPDTTHLAHTGGQQTDDTKCVDCHVRDCPSVDPTGCGTRKLYAPIQEIHRPLNSRAPNASPRWSRVYAEITSVQDMKPGLKPTVRFRLLDRDGPISPIEAPTVPMDLSNPPSPVPRRLTGLSLVFAGPSGDYVSNNNVGNRVTLVTRRSSANTAPVAPSTAWWDIAPGFSTTADGAQEFTYTFTTAIPATASGTWAIGIEGRRRADGATGAITAAPDYLPQAPLYAGDAFNWPYTGEAISEHFTNDLKYVDLATGTLTTAGKRRSVVVQTNCERCHMELNLHGANRHDVQYCVLCHAPDATDWDKRPRDTRATVGTGMVLLNDPIDPAASAFRWGYATLDGLEERSVHFKVMIHQIHVGEREGPASLEGVRPYVIYGNAASTAPPNPFYFDDVRFPGNVANCELCHAKNTWTIESIPAGAASTLLERANIAHTGTSAKPATSAHAATETKRLPIAAACLSCHTSGGAVAHAADKTSGAVEPCGTCHGEGGAESVRKWHAVP